MRRGVTYKPLIYSLESTLVFYTIFHSNFVKKSSLLPCKLRYKSSERHESIDILLKQRQCYEYILSPLVNKKAALAYGVEEYSQAGRDIESCQGDAT